MRACAAFFTGVEALLNVNQVAKNTDKNLSVQPYSLNIQLLLSTQFIEQNRAPALSNKKS